MRSVKIILVTSSYGEEPIEQLIENVLRAINSRPTDNLLPTCHTIVEEPKNHECRERGQDNER